MALTLFFKCFYIALVDSEYKQLQPTSLNLFWHTDNTARVFLFAVGIEFFKISTSLRQMALKKPAKHHHTLHEISLFKQFNNFIHFMVRFVIKLFKICFVLLVPPIAFDPTLLATFERFYWQPQKLICELCCLCVRINFVTLFDHAQR